MKTKLIIKDETDEKGENFPEVRIRENSVGDIAIIQDGHCVIISHFQQLELKHFLQKTFEGRI